MRLFRHLSLEECLFSDSMVQVRLLLLLAALSFHWGLVIPVTDMGKRLTTVEIEGVFCKRLVISVHRLVTFLGALFRKNHTKFEIKDHQFTCREVWLFHQNSKNRLN